MRASQKIEVICQVDNVIHRDNDSVTHLSEVNEVVDSGRERYLSES